MSGKKELQILEDKLYQRNYADLDLQVEQLFEGSISQREIKRKARELAKRELRPIRRAFRRAQIQVARGRERLQ